MPNKMSREIYDRILTSANFIVQEKCTIRFVEKQLGIPKSTVFMDVTKRLPEIDSDLALEVRKILNFNKQERSSRGGIALKRKINNIKYV